MGAAAALDGGDFGIVYGEGHGRVSGWSSRPMKCRGLELLRFGIEVVAPPGLGTQKQGPAREKSPICSLCPAQSANPRRHMVRARL